MRGCSEGQRVRGSDARMRKSQRGTEVRRQKTEDGRPITDTLQTFESLICN